MLILNCELKTYPEVPPYDHARVYFAVKSQKIDEVDGKIMVVSNKCMNFKEVDEEAKRLIEELKIMKKRAKAFFDKEKQSRSKTVDKPL